MAAFALLRTNGSRRLVDKITKIAGLVSKPMWDLQIRAAGGVQVNKFVANRVHGKATPTDCKPFFDFFWLSPLFPLFPPPAGGIVLINPS